MALTSGCESPTLSILYSIAYSKVILFRVPTCSFFVYFFLLFSDLTCFIFNHVQCHVIDAIISPGKTDAREWTQVCSIASNRFTTHTVI